MESPEILIINDPNDSPIPWDDFHKSPEKLFNEKSSHLWLATRETISELPSCRELLTSETSVLQCSSPGLLSELLTQAPTTVRSALGLTGITAIPQSSLPMIFQNESPANPVELLLKLTEIEETWAVEQHAGASFSLRSAIPASSSTDDRSLLATIRSIDKTKLATEELSQTEIMAGLLLIHDFLEPSHQFSQSLEGEGVDANGDYWHGIMHRREPDFGNSKYWFRRVGTHPCFTRLAEEACKLVKRYDDDELTRAVNSFSGSEWDSFAVVDFFQEAHRPNRQGTAWHQFAEELQMLEMLLLLNHCLC
ncbi:MAG: hypothetical protein HUJ26_15100 [Planctomycetaceae bacterium]|nr:hypothetical protein [Planctomycetaceae bacterium]